MIELLKLFNIVSRYFKVFSIYSTISLVSLIEKLKESKLYSFLWQNSKSFYVFHFPKYKSTKKKEGRNLFISYYQQEF